ncbi:response regulator transcription factor [Ferrimonas balearica]|uniref:response regulator transcription factor n=1 Tax=Ferrimonas balearica TaxID=44012 RepID=UPI001C584FF5|nr:response regulator transcription factor [Ferrimonas balearica]MBW3139843.1 response regulator transcription factor [Ferrimonas balearica]
MTCANILLIEDDIQLARWTQEYLEAHGLNVEHHRHGNRLEQLPLATHFDLVLCDVMLPGRNGFEIVEAIRQRFSGPILMLTARNTEEDQLRGLHGGASDYLVKPISPALLLARIQAHLRQQQRRTDNSLIQVDGLTLDPAENRACYQGEDLNLTPSEFCLLALFAAHYRQVLTREFLFTHGIGRAYDGLTRTIDGRITRLRKKLEGKCPLTIKTIWGKGYLLTRRDEAGS